MKRIISLIICAVVVLSLSACGEGNTKKITQMTLLFRGRKVILNGMAILLLD